MFLAHFSHTSLEYWLEQPYEEIVWWYNQALETHKKLNPPING
jgi:hypothetical protein